MKTFCILSIYLFLLLGLFSCQEKSEFNIDLDSLRELPLPILKGFDQLGDTIHTDEKLESFCFPKALSSNVYLHFDSLKPVRGYFTRLNDTLEISKSPYFEIVVDPTITFTDTFLCRVPFEYFLGRVDDNGNYIPPEKYVPKFVAVQKFPVFVFNFSDSVQLLGHDASRITCIQEAQDENGEWCPIEYFNHSSCGNSYGYYLIDPNQYLLFGVHQYAGEFKTKLRLRVFNRGEILFSNEYEGCVNRDQLRKEETDDFYQSYL